MYFIPQENVFYLENPQEVDNVSIGRAIRYKCSNCGKETTIKLLRSKYIPRIKTNFMCGDCSRKITNILRYGVENVGKSEYIKQKIKRTTFERFGVENASQSEAIKAKKRQTTYKNFGVEYPFQSKEVKAKCDKTNKERYGNTCPAKTDIVKERIVKTNQERYGVKCTLQVKEFQQKRAATWMAKYGNKEYMATRDFKRKSRKTCYERYGTPTPFLIGSPEYSALMMNKYGSTNPFKFGSKEYMYNMCKKYNITIKFNSYDEFILYLRATHPEIFYTSTYIYNGLSFDSTWELAFYLYHLDAMADIIREPTVIKYIHNFNIHRCFPDFSVNGHLFEIKGDHFFRPNGNMYLPFRKSEWSDEEYRNRCQLYEAKHQALLRNNVTILKYNDIKPYLDYINYYYGPNYLEMFNKSAINNISYGYTPYNTDQTKEFQDPIYKGLTPYDENPIDMEEICFSH